MESSVGSATSPPEREAERPHSRFEEMARRAEMRLADARAVEVAAEKARREFQRAEDVRQAKVIFERFVTEDVRDELHPIYTSEEAGKAVVILTVGDAQFGVELNLRLYEEEVCPIYAFGRNEERVLIGKADFTDRALFEPRLLVALHAHLRQAEEGAAPRTPRASL